MLKKVLQVIISSGVLAKMILIDYRSMSSNSNRFVPVLRSIRGWPPTDDSDTAGPVEVPLPGLEQPVRGYPNPLTAPTGEGGRYTPLPPNRGAIEVWPPLLTQRRSVESPAPRAGESGPVMSGPAHPACGGGDRATQVVMVE